MEQRVCASAQLALPDGRASTKVLHADVSGISGSRSRDVAHGRAAARGIDHADVDALARCDEGRHMDESWRSAYVGDGYDAIPDGGRACVAHREEAQLGVVSSFHRSSTTLWVQSGCTTGD